MKKIGTKFDAHKLKKYIDFSFILVENVVIKLDKIISFYLDFYNSMIENEIILANITNKDRVLHIGCGPIPVTSIHIAKKIGAQVTGIDKNLHSVEQAQALLLRLKFSDKIQIIHADASKFSLEKFNLIIVSQGIKPYVETLKYISQVMRSDTRVIFRTSSSIDGKIVDKDMFLKDIFKLGKIVHQKKNSLMISILLTKK